MIDDSETDKIIYDFIKAQKGDILQHTIGEDIEKSFNLFKSMASSHTPGKDFNDFGFLVYPNQKEVK